MSRGIYWKCYNMISKTMRFVCIVNTNIYEYLYTVCTESLNSAQPIDGLYKITKM
jgi:hypothetical protein